MRINGIPASDGIRFGKALVYENEPLFVLEEYTNQPLHEKQILKEAIQKSRRDIEKLKQVTFHNLGLEHSAVFDAHLNICEDPELMKEINLKIDAGFSAAYAYQTVISKYESLFQTMNNEYMKDRVSDIKDVARRIIGYLLNKPKKDLPIIDREFILVAKELIPSEIVELNLEFVKGFITELGGRSSHSAIIARSLEIPGVIGVKIY